MSNNEIPAGENCQVPVETYKCSQCNFYTNHEYYLQQHNLNHGLQALMEQKQNSQCYGSSAQSDVKLEESLKTFQCLQCSFENTNESFYKEHLLTHTQFGQYMTTDSYMEQRSFDASVVQVKCAELNGLDTVLVKAADSEEYCGSYVTSEDLEPPVYRCSKENPDPEEKEQMQSQECQNTTMEISFKLLYNEVFRCDNCDYETNLKAFLKRHMRTHMVKVEIKEEALEHFKCPDCSYETEHEKYLKRHQLSHKQIKKYHCQKCSFETLYKIMYVKHVQAHKSKRDNRKRTYIKCESCSFEATSKEQLDIHKKIKHVTKNDDVNLSLFNCTFCKYQTNWEPCLKRHIDREHPNQKPVKVKKEEVKEEPIPEPPKLDLFRCHDCDFSSKSKQYLILHLKRSHVKTENVERPKLKNERRGRPRGDKGKTMYECKFRSCTFSSSIKSNYVYHLRKHQSQNPQRIMFHICDLCDFVAKSEDNLEEHKKRIHLNHLRQVYKCTQCEFKTVFKHSLKTHSIKHKRYTCDVCDEELESAYALVKHKRSHQVNPKNRIYLCDVCGFQSKNDRSLKMHKKTHNPEFKCPDCPFQTHSKVNFQNHCINHKSADEVTMFPCPHCSYQSRLKRNLAWHMKRHADPSKAQIFKCPSCEYQTFTNAQLKSHLMVHKSKEEVVMLKCDFCTFETKRKSNMVQHRMRHLKDSPDVPLLSCPDCNYTTVAKRHLNKHRKTHNVNPDKMFQCSYCPYKIHRKIYLMRHMENHKTLETFGNDQWQRYTFPPQPQIPITGVTVVPNLGQNMQNLGHNLM